MSSGRFVVCDMSNLDLGQKALFLHGGKGVVKDAIDNQCELSLHQECLFLERVSLYWYAVRLSIS